MPISLKTIAGGSGDPINSIREIHTDDLLHTTVEGTKWLRTGWVSTDINTYPLATRTTVPDDLTQNGFTQTSASTASVDKFAGGGGVESYFMSNSAKTVAAIPCGLTTDDLHRYILRTTDGGVNWSTLALTAETTHHYVNGAFGSTRCLFAGFDVSAPTTNNSKFIKTNTSLASPEASVNLTFPNARYTCWTGTNFLILSSIGKIARVPDATNSPTYLPDLAYTNIKLLTSPFTGVSLLVNGSDTSNNLIARSTDDGSSWTTVLNLATAANWQSSIAGIYKNTVNNNLVCIVGARNTVTDNQRINIYTSSDQGVTWNNVAWSFSWDGVTYNSVDGWPTSVAPAVNTTGNIPLQDIFRDSSGALRVLLKFNSTRFCYLQSKDEGVTWTMLKPTTRVRWTEFDTKTGQGAFYLADLSTGAFVVVNDMQSPNTNPIYKLQQDITYVGVPEELFTNITSTNSKLGKYTRLS